MAKFVKSLVTFGFCAIAFFACTSNKARSPEGISIADSDAYEASVYRQNCATCHGLEGHGKTTNGIRVPSLRFGEPAMRSEEEIYKQISVGKLPMPSFKGQLTESEMRRMAKFVKEEVQGRKETE